jgi:hypothetical protein
MSERSSPFRAELERTIFEPKRELVDQPRDEALKLLAQARATGVKEPWSKYVPFLKGTELQIEVRALGIPFSGTGTVDERTEDKLAFAVSVPVPGLSIPVKVRAAITYTGEGAGNSVVFSINDERESKKTLRIQSTPNGRILTPPGGLVIPTNAPFPAPDKVTLNVVHMRPTQDRVELEAQFAFPIPTAIVQVSRRLSRG